MIRKIIPIVAVMVIANGMVAQNSQQVELARERIQKWVETRQVISKESSDWKVQKESLLSTKELLQQQLSGLKDSLADLEGNETTADSKRAELTQEKKNLDAATNSVKAKIADLELQVKEYIKYFPVAFASQVDPLLRRMPEDPYKPGRTTVSERLQNIVGIVQAASKFNSTLHLFRETVEVDGHEIQVDVLYWGMGIAYFVDQKSAYAGYKYPTADGWKTKKMSDVAIQVRKLVDMYQRKNPNIEFVDVPTAIN